MRLVRLIYGDRLETPFQRGIFFNVLTIFIDGRCANQLNFPAGKRRFENIGCIECALRTACADHGMNLIDKHQNVLICSYFLYYIFNALFKLAAVFGTGHHSGQIQNNQPLIADGLRHISCGDFRGKTFYNRRFADARLTDQTRIVFGSPA